ncbi:DinB family protein [Lutibacter citreus]|uniref:DinB family protein n=1 Tax=Lutibacter citreus TaxID=2138210 RepID=UPI000DBE813B|nr:DinB family protein [Lutibacter citreus]
MIKSIEKNLNRGVQLLQYISDENYRNASIAPYYSSIGVHMRHVLDVFDCIFEGLPSNQINLINRKRNVEAENYTAQGIIYFNEVLNKLKTLEGEDFNKIVKVTDNLGLGVISADYTLGGILIQAHSHAIHHFASVGYVICQLEIDLPDADFGFNPTTPRKIKI